MQKPCFDGAQAFIPRKKYTVAHTVYFFVVQVVIILNWCVAVWKDKPNLRVCYYICEQIIFTYCHFIYREWAKCTTIYQYFLLFISVSFYISVWNATHWIAFNSWRSSIERSCLRQTFYWLKASFIYQISLDFAKGV